jgi:tungstate transport system substrate-binding protein
MCFASASFMKCIRSSIALLLWVAAAGVQAQSTFVTLASTTSAENSGLFDVLLPKFTAQSGIEVRVVAVGTGQAIQLARNGDADVLLVHHTPSETRFVRDGFGVERFDVMYNDFVLVGPRADPAGVGGRKDVVEALAAIADSSSLFVSRGDESGTHKKERELWAAAQIDPSLTGTQWYRETGSGMGAALNVASALDAYALTDRATWLKSSNKGDLALLLEGDDRLFNQYGITLVHKDKHPHVKSDEGQKLVDWILSSAGQAAINAYTIGGQQAFFANARR